MRLEPKAFGLAAGSIAVVLFAICAVAVTLAPAATTAIGGFLLHADLSGFVRSVTFANFIGGLLGWGIGTALVFASVAAVYNQLSGARAGG